MLDNNCDCGTYALTHKMPGVGPSSRYMVVGQGPGGHEDMAGVPFVGRSGKLLRGMLSDAGIRPDDCFFTNATRCRLPGDRKPTHEEIERDRKYLIEEIHNVKPQVIIALGDSALQSLCKKSGISGKRGQSFPLHADFDYECEVWPTYHPAYVLRIPQVRDTVVADLRRIRDRHLPQDEVPWVRMPNGLYGVYSNSIVVDRHWQAAPVAWDIETDYDPKVKGSGKNIIQMAVAEPQGKVRVYDEPVPVRAFEYGDTVTHNGWAFDVPRNTGSDWGRDTLVMAYLDDETQPLGLEALCVKYLGVHGWKDQKDAPPGSDEFALYNARDAWYTLKLYEALSERLGNRIKIADEIILPAYLALRSASERGTYIDQKELEKYVRLQLSTMAAAQEEVESFGVDNPNSVPQLKEAFRREGYDLVSTDKQALNGLATPLSNAVLGYRSAAKSVTTLRKYAKMERAHPTYNLWRTLTGRSACKEPNVQQLDRKFKGIFSAPPGKVRINADYSAVEFRLGAWVANEESILSEYIKNPQWDPHGFFARRFFQRDFSPEERTIAKTVNLSQEYMGTWRTIQDYAAKQGIHLSRGACEALHNEWHRTFPGFRQLYDSVKDAIREHGFVESATGRRRHFGDVRLMNGQSRLDAQRQGTNFLVQSLAADLAYVALARLHELGLPLTDFIHDSIAVEVDDDPATIEDTEGVMREVMTSYAPKFLEERFGVGLDIPLEVDFTETRSERV